MMEIIYLIGLALFMTASLCGASLLLFLFCKVLAVYIGEWFPTRKSKVALYMCTFMVLGLGVGVATVLTDDLNIMTRGLVATAISMAIAAVFALHWIVLDVSEKRDEI